MSLLSSTLKEVILKWMQQAGTPDYLKNKSPIVVFEGAKPLRFAMSKPTARTSHDMRITGNRSTVMCNFEFARYLTSSIMNTYIPSGMIVALSWVSFWIDVNAVPGRVTLGVTALLTLATEVVHARSSIPPVNYMTAIDVWLFYCLIMVFASLIEFTISYHCYHRKRSDKKQTNPPADQHLNNSAWTMQSEKNFVRKSDEVSNSQQEMPSVSQVNILKKMNLEKQALLFVLDSAVLSDLPIAWKFRAERIMGSSDPPEKKDPTTLDSISRVLFPSSFVLFCIVYWSVYYSSTSKLIEEDEQTTYQL